MQDTIREAKRALRQQIYAALKRMSPEQRATASGRIRARLATQSLWQTAQSVLFFASLPDELDLWPLMAQALSLGKAVVLPRFVPEAKAYEACPIQLLEQDLEVGHFGIREPRKGCPRLASDRVDLILVPGVAFDLAGRRLGRGKGYYDQLLRTVHGTTCGVAFDEQIVDEVPVTANDVRLNCVVTPTRWVEVRAGR